MAIRQESILHSAGNRNSYRNLASNAISYIRKQNDYPFLLYKEQVQEKKTFKALNAESIRPYIASSEALIENGYPMKSTIQALEQPVNFIGKTLTCERCASPFILPHDLNSFFMTACTFHYGRAAMKMVHGEKIKTHWCCGGRYGSPGCNIGPHVFKSDSLAILNAQFPFVEIPENHSSNVYDVVGLDCEMVYTTGGFELARLTVINAQMETVLDELVHPRNPIIDYNARFSGIKDLNGVTMDLAALHQKLFKIVSKNTTLVGHSLESDLKVLRLIHDKIADTSLVFPHPKGLPIKYSLKFLANKYLNNFIQEGDGHDSKEDAKTCLELLMYQSTQDEKIGIKME